MADGRHTLQTRPRVIIGNDHGPTVILVFYKDIVIDGDRMVTSNAETDQFAGVNSHARVAQGKRNRLLL